MSTLDPMPEPTLADASADSPFKYDAAFSFLDQDELLARDLCDLLQDRFRTFIYSKQQRELAGTDGERTFNRVFGAEARVVAVLYRPGWGQTSWTRIEETAIRNRAFDKGYEFVVLIPVEKGPPPEWFPKPFIWVDFDRWGKEGAAAVLEERIQRQGGETRVESVAQRAARLKRAMEREAKRQRFMNSIEGVNCLRAEADRLVEELRATCQELKDEQSLALSVEQDHYTRGWFVHGLGVCTTLFLRHGYGNMVDEQWCLVIRRFDGYPDRPERAPSRRSAREVERTELHFDNRGPQDYVWVSGQGKAYSTTALAQHVVTQLMDLAQCKAVPGP